MAVFYAPDLAKYTVGKHVEPAWASVFYNPKMALSRDMGVALIEGYSRWRGSAGLTVVEPLSATGVRGIRYAKECESVSRVILNDIDEKAYMLIKENIRCNGLEHKVEAHNLDARALLDNLPPGSADVIDIDPFGTPIPFLGPAVTAVRHGGMLCLTATDLPPLYGLYPRAALRKYGARVVRTDFLKEVGVRILIGYVLRVSASLGRRVLPLYSQATDHYIRLCFEVRSEARLAGEDLRNIGNIAYCGKCLYRGFIKSHVDSRVRCPTCGAVLSLIGPVWQGGLWNRSFLSRTVEEYSKRKYLSARGYRVLKTMMLEAGEPPLYYRTDTIARKYGLATEPPLARLLEALREGGFRGAPTHFDPKGFRTDAGMPIILGIMGYGS